MLHLLGPVYFRGIFSTTFESLVLRRGQEPRENEEHIEIACLWQESCGFVRLRYFPSNTFVRLQALQLKSNVIKHSQHQK